METLFEIFKSTWYIWALVLVACMLKISITKIRGFFGEKAVAFFLSKLDPAKYKVINNIMLQVGGRTTQIDHVVVSNYGIFVIETKNCQGWILGNEFDDYWTQVIYKRKEKLHNPIKQNYGHIQALKEVLGECTDVNYISIVAFTTKADLKVKANTGVIYTINLPKTIRKYNTLTISDSVKEQIYEKLLSLNIDNKENRKAHVQAIHNNVVDIYKKVDANTCPKCGGNLLLRNGKFGQFKGCSNYPKCRFIAK